VQYAVLINERLRNSVQCVYTHNNVNKYCCSMSCTRDKSRERCNSQRKLFRNIKFTAYLPKALISGQFQMAHICTRQDPQ